MSESVFHRLQRRLSQQQIAFDVQRHPAVYTSQQAAEVRGTSLASGAKALICKADGLFVMFVLPADLRLASKRVRKQAGFRSLRFASAAEVSQLTGLEPGSIPPFGSLFGLKTFCDHRLADQPRINFNAGDHCISVSMTYDDYAAAEQPTQGDFGE